MKSAHHSLVILLAAWTAMVQSQTREVSLSYGGVPGYDPELGPVLEWSEQREGPRVSVSQSPPRGLRFRWLGASGFEMGDDRTTLLIDPFVSRPTGANPLAPLIIDSTSVDELILKPIGDRKIDAILVTHAHADHVMDVPYVISITTTDVQSPLLVGDPNTVALMESYGVPTHSRVLSFERDTVHYKIGEFGDFAVEAVRSLHPQYDFLPWRGPKGEIRGNPPFTGFDYVSYRDITITYVISYRGLRIVFSDGPMLQNLEAISRTDILILGTPVRETNTIAEALAALRPTYFIPTHYDDFFVPLHEMNQFDVTIGLTVPIPGQPEKDVPIVDFSRFGEFLEEFPSYVKKARGNLPPEARSHLNPKLRLLKPLVYYSLEA